MRISAVVITLNEEINIARCIESLIPVADEIVIVDALSSDATQNICSKYNVRFISHKWEGYARQKNFANSLATNDLILSIDAD
ncbi:MAG: glycosyltransferase, partial [Bacteroidales bacterium]|nr:glycosyltransferase [Bacteroidales bacterium]